MTVTVEVEAPAGTAPDEVVVVEPGVYDMPEDVYHRDPVPGGSLSVSGAKKLLPPDCPARFAYDRAHPPVPTHAMEIGTAAHKMVLGIGAQLVVIDAKDYRTQAARDTRDAARLAGKVPLLPAEYAQAQAMADAVRVHPVASALFNPDNGAPERSLFWQDPEMGVWLRSRLDWLPHPVRGWGQRMVIADLKTTASADKASVAKSMHNYGYFQQAPFYSDGVRALGLDDDPAFVFVFVESDPPHLISVAQLDDEAMTIGRALNRIAIERYRDCVEAGVWPGYSDEIELISLPPWALRQLEALQ
jgi:PDDEXK-like domain of unknown function (DUF3799)